MTFSLKQPTFFNKSHPVYNHKHCYDVDATQQM